MPELHGEREVEPLAGGLTNTNYKVTTPAGRYVVRISGKDTGLLAIDRENEVHNTIAAAETGVGAPFVAALPEHDALVLGFLDGEVMDAEKLRRGDRLESIAAACRRLHGGRRFLQDFDMFEIQRGYVAASCRSAASGCPTATSSSSRRCERSKHAMRVRREPTRAVQQRPARGELHRRRRRDAADRLRVLRATTSRRSSSGTSGASRTSRSTQLEELVAHYYGAPLRNKVARARLWGLMSKYGWTLWGSIQDGISDLDFDFWGWAMEKYDRAVAEFDGPGVRAAARGRQARGLSEMRIRRYVAAPPSPRGSFSSGA